MEPPPTTKKKGRKEPCSSANCHLYKSFPLPNAVRVVSGHCKVCCFYLILCLCLSSQERAACSPDCACHQQHDWESEELVLNSLQELNVCGLRANRDFMFVKRLLGWMGALKSVTIIFDPKATVHEELCEELLGLSGPETCVKIYLYRDGAKVMYTPVG
jgi:hypothetical protein